LYLHRREILNFRTCFLDPRQHAWILFRRRHFESRPMFILPRYIS